MLRDLPEITLIFGRNGSGKSLLLRGINEAKQHPVCHYSSPERGGDISYQTAMNEQELEPKNRGGTRHGRNFAANYRQEAISRLGTLMTKLGHAAGRGALTPDNQATFGSIEATIGELLVGFDFKVKDTTPFFDLFRVDPSGSDSSRVANVNELSSGEAEVLTVALDLLTICHIWQVEGHKQRLVLLDEPDPHLHPELQARFATFLASLVRNFGVQLIVATHSTTLLAAITHLDHVGVGVVYLNNSSYEQKALPAGETIRRLSAVLGGHALLGPLFAAPMLLVEGDDDYMIWSQVPRHPGYRGLFSAIPAGGDKIFEHQKLLESVFGSIREETNPPAGYALLDGDKPVPEHTPADQIRFIRLACHEAENLYLTDQVLGKIGVTWGDVADRLRQRASDFGEKGPALLALAECTDRRNADLKGLMVPLVQIVDDKNVPWTLRLGQVLGQGRPFGDLADYLGPEVLEALWPLG